MMNKNNVFRVNRLLILSLLFASYVCAQPREYSLGSGPWIFETYEEPQVEVSVVARNLDHPFGMVFVPNTSTESNPLGDILITERTGKVRLLRNGQLQEGVAADFAAHFPMEQLFDIKLHPQFEENGLLYFTYIRTAPHPDGTDAYWVTTAMAKGRFNGEIITDLEDVFVAEAWSSNIGGASSRLHFMPDNTILFGVSHRLDLEAPQRLDSHIGKLLRINDDGSTPRGNPYSGVSGALPQIYSTGIRSVMDFASHPTTGEIWELENGPQGGDEVNIIKSGNNYGWPIATFGRDYDGTLFNPQPWTEGTELPMSFWVPSITVGSLAFYTGDKFPNWKDNLFVTSMIMGRVPGTGHLERIVYNEEGEMRREQMLNSLKQRIRYVIQGPDDLIYLLTDSSDGALLRMRPVSSDSDGGELELNDTELFSQHNCQTCHRTEDTLAGPSYRDIANRYSFSQANIDYLANKIIQGGGGAWGEVPMAPHDDMQEAVAKTLSTQILGL